MSRMVVRSAPVSARVFHERDMVIRFETVFVRCPASSRSSGADRTRSGHDPDAVRAFWEDAMAAPDWTGPAVWLHGDLHSANVLTAHGTLCGVVDFGDLCAGDPACDLAAAWNLLPDGATDRFYETYRPVADTSTRRRARGWAVLRALVCVLIGDAGVHGRPAGKATWGPPAHAALRRLVED